MKLNTVNHSIESSGMGAGIGFKIAVNPKTFHVLSDGMYSHIIPTMIRELSSNAFDAHDQAEKNGELGKSKVPFSISVPNSFDPYFEVEDTGTGLRIHRYDAIVTNDHVGESNIYIDGDIRNEIEGIDMFAIDDEYVSMLGVPLYDTTKDQTVIRVMCDIEGFCKINFDDALVLTTTFFKSTKEDTNDQIGAWGLGFKTPQAYTDNYFLINRFEGIQRTYNIYKDENNLPMIRVVKTEPTNEHNGVKIRVAVEPCDFEEFKRGVISELRYFTPRPIIMNEPVNFPELIYDGIAYALYENNEYAGYSRANGMVGNNAYEIRGVSSEVFNDGNLVLKFNIGEIMVTASREELKYDEETYELIRKRESDALEEYRDYLLEGINLDGKTTHEKAAWMNQNHRNVIKLNSDEVRAIVGDPQFRFTEESIKVPLSNWGSYHTVSFEEWDDSDGTKKINMRKGYWTNRPVYKKYNYRTNKLENFNTENIFIMPNTPVTIFLKDTNYSFLKKISYYCRANSVSSEKVYVLLADMGDDVVTMLKDVLGDLLTVVSIDAVEIPKNTISYKPTNYNPTPVARMFNVANRWTIGTPKEWADIFTSLTKIDTDAYIVCTHRNEIQNINYSDMEFLKSWMDANHEDFDQDMVILAMPQAKYHKAIGYGFTPLQEWIDELKKDVVYPQWIADHTMMEKVYGTISQNNAMDVYNNMTLQELKDNFGKDNPITVIRRIREVWKKRYNRNCIKVRAFNSLAQWVKLVKPEPSEFCTKLLDLSESLCQNVTEMLVLLEGISSWQLTKPDKKEALISYTKFVFTSQENVNE